MIILVSICHDTLSFASWITPIERVSHRVLPEAGINIIYDQEHLIDNKTDDRKTDDKENDYNDDVDPCAPLWPTTHFADVVEQQRATVERQERMIEFLLQQNTKLLSWWESTRKNCKFDITKARRFCGGPSELDTFLGSLC